MNEENYCANLATDNQNCGTCGNVCAAGQVCSNGACAVSCGGDESTCTVNETTYCANEKTDNANCGACGVTCAAGTMCSDGVCTTTCGTGLTTCGTGNAQYCSDIKTDVANCGACGNVCAAGKACLGGKCRTLAVEQCLSGADPGNANLTWVVCSASLSEAWVSMLNHGGQFHAEAICKQLGYSKLGTYGGTCGNVCGYCQPTTSCSSLGKKTFDGGGTCGSDALGQILCSTVMWQCLP